MIQKSQSPPKRQAKPIGTFYLDFRKESRLKTRPYQAFNFARLTKAAWDAKFKTIQKASLQGQFWYLTAQNFTNLEDLNKNIDDEIIVQGLVIVQAQVKKIVVRRAKTDSIPSSLIVKQMGLELARAG